MLYKGRTISEIRGNYLYLLRGTREEIFNLITKRGKLIRGLDRYGIEE